MLLSCGITWPENTDCDSKVFKEAAEGMMEKMAEFGEGVYFDKTNEDLKSWKTAQFGANYDKLVDVKRAWDPNNFLYCENCVASDFRFDCFKDKMSGMQLSDYLFYTSGGSMFNKY